MDAALIPDQLHFTVTAIPRAILEKAAWFVDCRDERTYVNVDRDDEEEQVYLSQRCTQEDEETKG